MYIYCLKLFNNKYYIGKTEDYNKRFTEHITGEGAKWTKLYKPIEIIFVTEQKTNKDENLYTIAYMVKYGHENVRGGDYCKVEGNYKYMMRFKLYDNMENMLYPEKTVVKNKII